jgi:mannose-6-phosphate isomerase-like protein (cupin superfamily)
VLEVSVTRKQNLESRKKDKATVRRVITGLTTDGRSTILSDDDCPHTMPLEGIPTFRLTEMWKTTAMPALIDDPSDHCSASIELAPFPSGTTLRFLEFPPDSDWQGLSTAKEAFYSMGESGAEALAKTPGRHAMMHRTHTVDYIVILSGEIYAVLEEKETLLKAGDVLIQRGTNHAWSNRSDGACLVIAVLVDGRRNS